MDQEIIDRLKKEEPDEGLERLVKDINKWLCYSRGKMKSRWCRWDKNFSVFNGERVPDEGDIEASDNGEPMKMVVPLTHTQVMTWTTYAYFQLRQNPNGFFQFAATGNEDYPLGEPSTTMLDRDLNRNDFAQKLVQILLDAGIYGLFATKVSWDERYQWVEVPIPAQEVNVGPFTVSEGAEVMSAERVLQYEGNKLEVISPYHIIPDMRIPLTRWKEGRFVADEQEYHISRLKELEDEGVYAGVEFVTPFTSDAFENSKRHKGTFEAVVEEFSPMKGRKGGAEKDEDDFMCITTEGHFRLVPRKYDLGDEDYPVDFLVTLANDRRAIRVERLRALHGESIYSIGEYLPNQQNELSVALADPIDALQEVVTYLINSRVEAVRMGLDGKTIADPRFIDIASLESRAPVVLLKKSAPLAGIDKFVSQLKVQDNTTSNINDAEVFIKLIQMVTGVNENAMGQYAPGRRSASENRAANQGAASRMNLHANLLWEQVLAPMGRKMLINLRQGLSIESFVKIIGESSPVPQYPTIEALYEAMCPSDPRMLIGNEDFFVYDGQSTVEKQFLAQALQELVGALAANPMVLTLTNYDITKLIDSIQQLRGVKNVARFKNPQPLAPAAVQPPGTPPDAAGVASAAGGLPLPPVQGGAPSV